MINLTSIFIVCFVLCAHSGYGADILSSGISSSDQKNIVNIHNDYRKLIANGTLLNQPRGVNLLRMIYDDALAEAAQAITNTTVYGHEIVEDGRWYVGQNIYYVASTKAGSSPNWAGAIQSWFKEYSSYNYSTCCSSAALHYTQIVWATTQYVGCGFTYFKESESYPYKKLYVCNYGPGGNLVGNYPYKTGDSGCEDLCD